MSPHFDSVQAHTRSSAISSTIFAVNQSERREIRTLSESMYFHCDVKIVNFGIYKQSISWNEIVFGGVFFPVSNVANLECYFVRNILFTD